MNIVYLLFEGDQWLTNENLVLMGIFDNENSLFSSALELINNRIDEHCHYAVTCLGFDEDDEDLKEIVATDILHELKDNNQTQTWFTNYMIKEVQLNKLEEVL